MITPEGSLECQGVLHGIARHLSRTDLVRHGPRFSLRLPEVAVAMEFEDCESFKHEQAHCLFNAFASSRPAAASRRRYTLALDAPGDDLRVSPTESLLSNHGSKDMLMLTQLQADGVQRQERARALEEKLRGIMQELVDDVSPEASFMDAGLDSRTALQFVDIMDRRPSFVELLGGSLPTAMSPNILFDFPTVRTLAHYLANDGSDRPSMMGTEASHLCERYWEAPASAKDGAVEANGLPMPVLSCFGAEALLTLVSGLSVTSTRRRACLEFPALKACLAARRGAAEPQSRLQKMLTRQRSVAWCPLAVSKILAFHGTFRHWQIKNSTSIFSESVLPPMTWSRTSQDALLPDGALCAQHGAQLLVMQAYATRRAEGSQTAREVSRSRCAIWCCTASWVRVLRTSREWRHSCTHRNEPAQRAMMAESYTLSHGAMQTRRWTWASIVRWRSGRWQAAPRTWDGHSVIQAEPVPLPFLSSFRLCRASSRVPRWELRYCLAQVPPLREFAELPESTPACHDSSISERRPWVFRCLAEDAIRTCCRSTALRTSNLGIGLALLAQSAQALFLPHAHGASAYPVLLSTSACALVPATAARDFGCICCAISEVAKGGGQLRQHFDHTAAVPKGGQTQRCVLQRQQDFALPVVAKRHRAQSLCAALVDRRHTPSFARPPPQAPREPQVDAMHEQDVLQVSMLEREPAAICKSCLVQLHALDGPFSRRCPDDALRRRITNSHLDLRISLPRQGWSSLHQCSCKHAAATSQSHSRPLRGAVGFGCVARLTAIRLQRPTLAYGCVQRQRSAAALFPQP